MCRYDDGERCDVWVETRRKARKQHKCYECGFAIRPGETYVRVNVVFDGTADSNAVCETCREWARGFVDAEAEACGETAGWMMGMLWEDVRQFAADHINVDATRGGGEGGGT